MNGFRPIDTVIDGEKCIGCGECCRVCPSGSITMKADKAEVTGAWSLGCGHCAAVCPVDAVTVGFVDADPLSVSSIEGEVRHVAPGEFDLASLAGLMASRRSCRNYLEKPVPLQLLEDLVRLGETAPSGTNSQLWTFTLLPDRSSVMKFGDAVADFYRRLNRKAESPFMRFLTRLFLKDALGKYYREYYEAVAEGLRQYDVEGSDRLSHGAPAVILVGSLPGGRCPSEDALLASQNILLAAHAAGLGTCMVNFIVEAIRHDPALARFLSLGEGEKIHAAIVLGYPDEKYVAPAGRRAVPPRVLDAHSL